MVEVEGLWYNCIVMKMVIDLNGGVFVKIWIIWVLLLIRYVYLNGNIFCSNCIFVLKLNILKWIWNCVVIRVISVDSVYENSIILV